MSEWDDDIRSLDAARSFDNATWISVSAVGDDWEVELDINSDRYRYRSACLGNLRTEWEHGRPPTGVHSLARLREDQEAAAKRSGNSESTP